MFHLKSSLLFGESSLLHIIESFLSFTKDLEGEISELLEVESDVSIYWSYSVVGAYHKNIPNIDYIMLKVVRASENV